PVVIGTEYNKDANVGFGTGTGSSSRFGERQEIIYTDKDVPYTWEWTWHEGIDKHTVNNDFDATIADRTELQAQAKVQLFDDKGGLFISKIADQEFELTEIANDPVLKLFNDLNVAYTNMEAVGTKM